MNNQTYLEKMIALTDELDRATRARPYNPDVYNSVIIRIQLLQLNHNPRRRRRPWAAVMFVICLLLVLLYIVWEILFNLKITVNQ